MSVKVLAVTNQKGGVGKTTTAVSLAAAFAEKGKKTLLVDLDPQGNATVACGLDRVALECGVMEVMTEKTTVQNATVFLEKSGFYLLPANGNLSADDRDMAKHSERYRLLKLCVSDFIQDFDWVFIDCPPTLNLLTVNAMVAANYVLVPIQCEYFALEGVGALLDTVGQIRNSVNPDLKVAGFLRTMYDARSRLTRDVSENLIQYLQGLVFSEIVPRNVRLAEAPSYGLPIMQYDERSKGAQSYRNVANELEERLGV